MYKDTLIKVEDIRNLLRSHHHNHEVVLLLFDYIFIFIFSFPVLPRLAAVGRPAPAPRAPPAPAQAPPAAAPPAAPPARAHTPAPSPPPTGRRRRPSPGGPPPPPPSPQLQQQLRSGRPRSPQSHSLLLLLLLLLLLSGSPHLLHTSALVPLLPASDPPLPLPPASSAAPSLLPPACDPLSLLDARDLALPGSDLDHPHILVKNPPLLLPSKAARPSPNDSRSRGLLSRSLQKTLRGNQSHQIVRGSRQRDRNLQTGGRLEASLLAGHLRGPTVDRLLLPLATPLGLALALLIATGAPGTPGLDRAHLEPPGNALLAQSPARFV